MVYAAKLTAADRLHRPVAYDPSAFPVHTTKCPTTTVPAPAAPSTTVAPSNHTSNGQRFVLHHASFTSCLAFLEPAASIVPRPPTRGSPLAHPNRSVSTSAARVDSGLNAQPLSNVCSTWLSVDPGIPFLAMTLATLNPLLCITPIILVPVAASIPFAKRLLPRSVPVFAINLAQLSSQLRSHLQVSTLLCHLLHQRQTPSHVPYPPMAPADPNLDVTPPLPPIDGANFTFPASPSAHSACAAFPWLLRVLNVIQIFIRTNPLRVFLISIACSRTDDNVSDLAAATSVFAPRQVGPWIVVPLTPLLLAALSAQSAGCHRASLQHSRLLSFWISIDACPRSHVRSSAPSFSQLPFKHRSHLPPPRLMLLAASLPPPSLFRPLPPGATRVSRTQMEPIHHRRPPPSFPAIRLR
jgi:hypothetical protein